VFFYTVTQQAMLMVSLSHPRPLSCPHLSHDPFHAIPLPFPLAILFFPHSSAAAAAITVTWRIKTYRSGSWRQIQITCWRKGGRERERERLEVGETEKLPPWRVDDDTVYRRRTVAAVQGLTVWRSGVNRGMADATPEFLADRTNGRAYATVLRPSVVVCNVIYCR